MRTCIVALVVAALIAGTSLPAAAQNTNFQTTFQLRYWGAGLAFGNPAPPTATDSGSGWGATIRLDSRNSPWGFSARYDSLSITPTNWVWNGATLYDVNVHYRFGPSLNQYLGVFAGYGYVSPADTTGLAVNIGSASGLRYGVEFLVRQPSGLYLTGDVAFGSWSTVGGAGWGPSSVTDYRAAIGYDFQGGWGLEAGYRFVSWRVGAGGGCGGVGCEWQFSGLTAALTFRR
jgi:hypothetical protein